VGLWRISKELKAPIDSSISSLGTMEYPYSISYVLRRRMQIDNFLELPKDKQPPRGLWDKPSELEEWFDRVFGGEKVQTEFTMDINEKEIE